jgi:hypothetical protein
MSERKHTYDDWRMHGRYVRGGERASLENGIYLFSESQTDEIDMDSFISDWATIHGY